MDIRGEVDGAEFGDKRLSKRLRRLAEQIARAPERSFPKAAGSDAALEATYRFLGNATVTPEAVLAPHVRATVARCADVGAVVVAHDSSEFRFSTDRDGLGRVKGDTTYGFIGHFALAVAARDRAPLGILGIATIFRERGKRNDRHTERRALSDKESRRWVELARRADVELGPALSAVHVMDREADAYELLALLSAEKKRFVVRLQFDRAADTELGRGRISDVLRGKRTLLKRDVLLSARAPHPRDPPSRGKKHPYRRERCASLSVSACAVTIRRPPCLQAEVPACLRLNVVRVREKNAARGVEPVEWRLVTSDTVDTAEDVAAVVDAYRARWVIEEYFRALKQGCAYEKRQLESKHALLNALAVFTPVAWQLLALRQLSRDDAELPADRVLSPLKLKLLQRHPDIRLRDRPTIRDAMLAIAKLGGHITNNGDPGWLVVGRGYEDLLLLERGAVLALGSDQS